MKLPSPPKDLWEQLASLRTSVLPPEGAFTTAEYADRYATQLHHARIELDIMVRSGKVKKIGKFGQNCYYQLS